MENKLKCNNIKKVNKYLDNENETDVDILLKKVNEIHKEKYLSDREISVNVIRK